MNSLEFQRRLFSGARDQSGRRLKFRLYPTLHWRMGVGVTTTFVSDCSCRLLGVLSAKIPGFPPFLRLFCVMQNGSVDLGFVRSC